MVIRLGKYLRIAGYDAAWDLTLRTHDLIRIANITGRIFITRNSHLQEQFPPAHSVITVASTDPVEQFRQLVRELDLDTRKRLFSRCIRCNVDLDVVADKHEIRARVHPNVLLRHDRFFRCPSCDTIFWQGSHVANTCGKLGLPLPA